MGQTEPIRPQFLPAQPNKPQQHSTMVKVWTYSNQGDANSQLQRFEQIRLAQPQCQCKIEQLYIEYLRQSRKQKVIAVFQYYSQSLRQHIITRKKQQSHRRYFTQKQLEKILNVIGFYIYKYYNQLCNHSDVFSSMFISGGQFKACHPQLLPNRCQQSDCDRSQLKRKVSDSIMELMLMQKIVKADQKQRQRAQNLYNHAPWLIELINDMFDSSKEVIQLCKRSQIVRQSFIRKEKVSTARQTETENVRQSTYSGGQRQYINDIKMQHRFPTNQQHYRSYSAQFQTQKSKPNKFMNLRPENPYNMFSLQNYQKQLAQSIVDHEESVLLLNSQFNQNINMLDNIQERQNHIHEELAPQTSSFMLSEHIPIEQDTRFEPNRSRSVHSLLPQTIFEQQNENNSQDSRKYLEHKESQSVIIDQSVGSHYQGDMLNGKKHGKGTIVFSNGVYYSGDWRDDQMTGFGTLYYASGNPEYIGEWQHNKFNGIGCFYNQNEEYFEGGFNYQDFDELGYKWKSCEGEFNNDMMEGEGILTLSNGQILKSSWRKNLLNGYGIFYTVDNRKIKGVWLDNKLLSCEVEYD